MNEVVDSKTGVITEVPFRTPYKNRPARELLFFDQAGKRTKDEFKDQCDVNKIWANFVKTGRLDQLQKAKGFYADLTQVPQSYQESLNLVVRARDTFEALPADIRNAFGNDVQAFLHAAEKDPDGLFEVLKPLQPIDGTAPPPVAPPKPDAPPEPPVPPVAPLQDPPK